MSEIIGRIHSIESMGTLDGPGIRTVIFFQGCPLKCQFCHNIDSTLATGGTSYTPQKLADKVLSYSSYWKKDGNIINGGITLSGGDAVLQVDFLKEFLPIVKAQNVHVAMDTSLYTSQQVIKDLLPYIDLWMVSMKHMDDAFHKKLTGVSNVPILNNIELLDNLLTEPKLRIRYLIVPEITDSEENISAMAKKIKTLKHLESIEILKYSNIGRFKWIELFGNYALEAVREATDDDVEKTKIILQGGKQNILVA